MAIHTPTNRFFSPFDTGQKLVEEERGTPELSTWLVVAAKVRRVFFRKATQVERRNSERPMKSKAIVDDKDLSNVHEVHQADD